jgi:DNA polymerase III subunit beta
MKAKSLTALALPILKAVMPRKTTIPILNHVLVLARDGGMIGIATDLDSRVEVRVNGDTPEGLYTIIGKELVPAVGAKAEHFPMPVLINSFAGSVTIPVSSIKATIPFISVEESRYTLHAMLLKVKRDQAVIVATDGHRLRVQRVGDPSKGFKASDRLVPVSLLALVARFAAYEDVNIQVSDNETDTFRYRIVSGNATFYGRNITGQFPNYEAVCPSKFPHHHSVNRLELLAALQTVQPFTDTRSGGITLEFAIDHVLTLKAGNDGYSRSVDVPYYSETPVNSFDGGKFVADDSHAFSIVMPMRIDSNIGMSVLYLLDVVKGFKTDRLFIGVKDHQTAVSFSGHNLTDGEVQHVAAA